MIAVETNILVYAHRADSPFHERALKVLGETARRAWAIPSPCLHEFIAVVTHPRIFDPPSKLEDARLAIAHWRESVALRLLTETEGYWEVLDRVLEASRVVGPRVHDARIAALCLHHAVDELLTADRDFSRFSLSVRNPLIESS